MIANSPEAEPTTRLTRFRVEGLFGLYTHDIPLNQNSRITAIIGPNGSGKTVCLKLIQSLFNTTFSQFQLTKFAACEWYFSDGAVVRLTKSPPVATEHRRTRPRSELRFEYKRGDEIPSSWTPEVRETDPRRRAQIERSVPYVTRVGPDLWRHDITGEIWSGTDVLEIFGDPTDRDSLRREYIENAPDPLSRVMNSVQCRLIETQRLLATPTTGNRRRQGQWLISPSDFQEDPSQTSISVEQKSSSIKATISSVHTQYANLSQSLDRIFPKRIFGDAEVLLLDKEAVSTQLEELETKRRELEAAGILESEIEPLVSVPDEIDQSLLKVISVYIEHTNRKLSIFSDLQRRIQAFETLLNRLLLDKTIKITQSDGMKVTSRLGTNIPLRALSSGEQHQLVLLFSLIFEAQAGELLLIDEPELSLHIGWQQTFIDHLKEIIQINPFDIVLATHSPALVGKHYRDIVVELGGSDDAQQN